MSSSSIEISPPVTPLHTLPYFDSSVRRPTPEIVRPGGKSGDAQRLFVFSPGETDKVQRDCALALTKNYKACVISPSKNKAGKDAGTEYSKSDISQCHDHRNWLENQKKGKVIRISIVGRESRVSNLSNPDSDLDVIELAGFRELAENVKNMLIAIDAGDRSSLENTFEGWLQHYGLVWPTCVSSLPNKLARELKVE